jgi:type IV pilus assembly protein PilB
MTTDEPTGKPEDIGGLHANVPKSVASANLYTPEEEDTGTTGLTQDLGQALISADAITAEQLTSARSVIEKSPGKRMADVLLDMGVDETAVQKARAKVTGVPFQRVDEESIEAERYINRLGMDFCLSHGVLPIRMSGPRLILGITNPDDLPIIDEIRHKLQMPIKTIVVCRADISLYIETRKEQAGEEEDESTVEDIIAGIEDDDVELVESKDDDLDLEKMAGESPVIRFVNYLIFNAVKEGASDIHIEPMEKKLQIRYRIDGLMFDSMSPPNHMKAAIVSRIKIMANLDIAERRLPQDGRIRAMVHGRKLDLRVSTLPMVSGEKIVMRILDTRSIQVGLDELGMDEDTLLMWKHQIDQPHGIVLVTGPTGSGKTTTLYASLGKMDRCKLNISTTEDPVEYHLDGINQTQVHDKIGMTFSAALRALLRQDPDVLMVGEIRDTETAKIAIQASLTGHLVLSTLHTNDAPSSVTRLINIGVEPYLIGSAVNATLAQRLVRKICDNCKVKVPATGDVADHLTMHGIASDEICAGEGCDKCRNTGYSGRLGLYEILVLDDNLRDKIVGNPNVTEFRRMCVERGMVTLREDGLKKVGMGLTTVDEILRVTESTI